MKDILFKLINTISGLGVIFIGVLLAFEFGFHVNNVAAQDFYAFHIYVLAFFLLELLIRLFITKRRLRYFFVRPTDLLLIFFMIYHISPTILGFTPLLLSQIVLLFFLVGRLYHVHLLFLSYQVKPPQMLALGFLFLILVGSLLLSLPIATTGAQDISYVDALFTATSSVCVTGLVINDTGQDFTFFGQIVVLTLIQLGGLGIMTFSALFAILLNRRFSQKESLEIQESYLTYNLAETFNLVKFIFKFTVLFEIMGALLLFVFWYQDYSSFSQAIFSSVFHSVSAFCNAGFSLFSDSFTGYVTNAPIILIMSMLIIAGGIGFPVILNLKDWFLYRKKRFVPIRLHTKLVLYVTGILLVFGTVILFINEYSHGLAQFGVFDKGLVAFFHSVSARTCGFNSIDLNFLGTNSILIIMILMFIGASPGSTGGGIKTTTFGVLMLTVWNTLRGRKKIELAGRAIRYDSIFRAISIIVLSMFILVVFICFILWSEKTQLLAQVFEAISAYGTVGLSLGVTKNLSIFAKTFIMSLMFIGRVGPLTIAIALAKQRPEMNYSYPEESVLMG